MATATNSTFYELYRSSSYVHLALEVIMHQYWRLYVRIGLALADTLDDLISSRRIEPQLAMRILQNFDQSIATVLGEKVKARMTFKVRALRLELRVGTNADTLL
jgi:hypothetical protein